jgi:hypothetical protein
MATQGIRLDLEKDSYINPSVRNMIVLDDLMSSAATDPRITDLFTEGSHHRNLSVVVLNLNLYFSKDPTPLDTSVWLRSLCFAYPQDC